MSDFERGLLDFLKREYGVSARIDQWSRHPRVIFTHNGIEREVPIPGSPSDWRSLHNMQADLRRLLGPRVKIIKRERRSLEDLDQDLKRRAIPLIEKAPPLPQEEKMSKRAPRRYNTADIAPLEVIRQRLNVNYSQFSQMLGYASNSYTDWVRTSKCPAVAVLAAETLLARAELPPELVVAETAKHYLLTVTPNEPPRVSPMGEVQRMTIAGRNYLLVEEA